MRTMNGNLVRFTSLCLVAAAGTIAGSAHGQTLGFGGNLLGPAPVGSSPSVTMSLEECTHGLQPGVPDTASVFEQLPSACNEVLGQHMTQTATANPQKVRSMYRVDPATWPENLASTTPGDMRIGLLDAFVEADTRLLSSSDVSYGGTMLTFSTPIGGSLIHTTSPQEAIAHLAHPVWGSRGTALGDAENPCGEWVWKGFYDYSRFEDAAAECGTNDECIYQVAYSSSSLPPGIANRTELRSMDTDGKYFASTYSIPLVKGFVSKNPFFGVSTAFLLDQQRGLLEDLQHFEMQKKLVTGGRVELQAGPKPYACAGNFRFRNPASKYYIDPSDSAAVTRHFELDQKLGAIRTLLQKKAGYLIAPDYADRWAHPQVPAANVFNNEWNYHKAMHDKQKPTAGYVGQPLPESERRANDERTKTLVDLMAKYAMLTSAVVHKDLELNTVVDPFGPLDDAKNGITIPGYNELCAEVTPDPFVYRLAVSSMRRDLVAPEGLASLESSGSVVTNQMALPFRLVAPQPTTTVPLGGTASGLPTPGATMLDTVSSGTSAGMVRVPTTLVGAERDYGKATNVLRASVGVSSTCPTPEAESEFNLDRYEAARAAQEVQEQIVALLIDELGRGADGCLSENGYNCDWSPTLFAQRFQGHFAKPREDAFQYCVLMTGGNTLDSPDPLFSVPNGFGGTTNMRTMARFPEHLESVKEILKAQLDGLPYRSDGEDDHRVGETTGGGKSLGHASWFGASYDYTAAWSVVPEFKKDANGFTKPTWTPCAFAGQANAEFNAQVSILGREIPLVHALGDGHTANGIGGRSLDVEFLGESYLANSGSEHFHQVDAGSVRTDSASATVVVVVVPVSFSAFGELEYGYDVEANMTSNNDCASDSPSPALGVQLRLQPFAKVNAVASAGVGVSGAQAGVRGRIALLDAKLPMTASLEIKPDPEIPGSIKLFPTASADMEVGALSGRMSAFAEVDYYVGTYTAEKSIFSWGGLHDSIPLFLLESDPVQLAAFNNMNWEDWLKTNKSHSIESQ